MCTQRFFCLSQWLPGYHTDKISWDYGVTTILLLLVFHYWRAWWSNPLNQSFVKPFFFKIGNGHAMSQYCNERLLIRSIFSVIRGYVAFQALNLLESLLESKDAALCNYSFCCYWQHHYLVYICIFPILTLAVFLKVAHAVKINWTTQRKLKQLQLCNFWID